MISPSVYEYHDQKHSPVALPHSILIKDTPCRTETRMGRVLETQILDNVDVNFLFNEGQQLSAGLID